MIIKTAPDNSHAIKPAKPDWEGRLSELEAVALRSGDRAWKTFLILKQAFEAQNRLTGTDEIQGGLERSILVKAVEQASASISILDEKLKLVYINQAFAVLTGYSRDEVLGRSPHFLNFSGDDPAFKDKILASIKQGITWKGFIRQQKKNGVSFEAETVIAPIKNEREHVEYFVAVQRDVTTLKKLERQRMKALKMAPIGALAGGIAHDFNNILGAIIGYTELSIFDAPKNSDIEYNMNQVLKAGNRARDLVDHILRFSRQSPDIKEPINLNEVAEEVVALIRAKIPSNIAIRIDENRRIGNVLADQTQILQVVLTLCANAIQVLAVEGGVLTLKTDDVWIDEESAALFGDISPGAYVELSLSDALSDVDSKKETCLLNRYSAAGAPGADMSLAEVQAIIKKHKGAMRLIKASGHNVDFRIYLPKIDPDDNWIARRFGGPLRGGDESILIVDDEPSLVELEHSMLEELGYRTAYRYSGGDAVELVASNPDRFDLVITDYWMPGMNGIQLASQLLAIKPDMRIILCMGFSRKIDRKKAASAGIRECMMKPIVFNELAEKVRAVLDS